MTKLIGAAKWVCPQGCPGYMTVYEVGTTTSKTKCLSCSVVYLWEKRESSWKVKGVEKPKKQK